MGDVGVSDNDAKNGAWPASVVARALSVAKISPAGALPTIAIRRIRAPSGTGTLQTARTLTGPTGLNASRSPRDVLTAARVDSGYAGHVPAAIRTAPLNDGGWARTAVVRSSPDNARQAGDISAFTGVLLISSSHRLQRDRVLLLEIVEAAAEPAFAVCDRQLGR
jgi:hypothetical protein